MKISLLLFTMLSVLNLSVFHVKSQAVEEPLDKSLNDILVLTTISKDLYICTSKPEIANPDGGGEINYQGKFNKDEVTYEAVIVNVKLDTKNCFASVPCPVEICFNKSRGSNNLE